MKKSIRVLIIGSIHHNTLGIIRSIGEAGIQKDNIFLIIQTDRVNEDNYLLHCKYISRKNCFLIPDSSTIINKLNIIAQDGVKGVIICCSDYSAKLIMDCHNRISPSWILPSANFNMDVCMSKEFQCSLASKCGLIIPKSRTISNTSSYNWSKFPCIVKPIISALGSKNDFFVANDLSSLTSYLNQKHNVEFLIQEFIDKKFEFQLIGCSLNNGKILIVPGYTYIIRQPYNTNTGYLKYIPISELENFDMNTVRKYIQNLSYNGLFSMEFIRGKNNVDYFLEINLRNDGNSYCVTTTGVNLPFIWVYYNAFGQLPKTTSYSFRKTIFFMPEFSDFKIGIKQKGFFRWIKEFCKADSHAIFSMSDPEPFVFSLTKYAFSKIKILFTN